MEEIVDRCIEGFRFNGRKDLTMLWRDWKGFGVGRSYCYWG